MAAIVGAATLMPAGAARADCYGRDLFAYYHLYAPERLERIEAAAARLPFGKGRLFRVSRAGARPSFLFGTLHVSDRRLAVPVAAAAALRTSAVLALEFALDDNGRPPVHVGLDTPVLRAAATDRPDRLLDPAEFARLERVVVADGLPAAAARLLKPEVLALALDLPRCAAAAPGRGDFLDAALARSARERGVPVVGLETFDEQIEAVGGLPAADEQQLLRATITSAGFGADAVETAVGRYLAGDLGALLVWSRGPILWPGLAVSAPPAAFVDRLLDRRTARLYRRALPLVEKGGAFIAVGAAHIAGEQGLARRFQEAGYEVTSVDPGG
ncbi:MAG TPA: TraB/GumN family protein [Hyphomicrobiales bacterium]|nr:TraB/GumN family protein [Hyphomicrobiales bacterium]